MSVAGNLRRAPRVKKRPARKRWPALAQAVRGLPVVPAAERRPAALGLLFASAGAHALALLLAGVLGRAFGGSAHVAEEPVRIKVVEVPPPPAPPPEPIAQPEPAAPETPPPVPKRTPPPERKLQPEPKPDPTPEAPASAAPTTAPVRRLGGLNLASTVQGRGPAFAVGNTQLGATAARAPEPSATTGGGGLVSPVRLSMPQPEYPRGLKLQEIEGRVRLSAVIGADGRPTQIVVVRGSGHDEFDRAAVQAAEQSVYQPALRDGVAVPVRITFTVEFRLL